MKNKFSMLLVSTVFIGAMTSASAFVYGNGHDQQSGKHNVMSNDKSERFMKHKFKKMAKYLALTYEQRQQAKVIHQQAKEKRLALKGSLQDFNQQSKALIMANNFDEQAFIDLQKQYQDSFAQMSLIKAKTKYNFMQILTEEQKEKVRSQPMKQGRGRWLSE
jgi:Spy/CpxP family protein refolding chaperone